MSSQSNLFVDTHDLWLYVKHQQKVLGVGPGMNASPLLKVKMSFNKCHRRKPVGSYYKNSSIILFYSPQYISKCFGAHLNVSVALFQLNNLGCNKYKQFFLIIGNAF